VRNEPEHGQIKDRKNKMKRIITILIGLFGLLMGVGLILPALAKVRDYGAMPGAVVGPYTLGIVLALAGGSIALYGIIRRKADKSLESFPS